MIEREKGGGGVHRSGGRDQGGWLVHPSAHSPGDEQYRGPFYPAGFEKVRRYLKAPVKAWEPVLCEATKTVLVENLDHNKLKRPSKH